MNARFARYMNDIVSLSVLLLMTIALVAGQVGANAQATESADRPLFETPVPFLNASLRMDADTVVAEFHIEMVIDELISALPVADTTEAIRQIVGRSNGETHKAVAGTR